MIDRNTTARGLIAVLALLAAVPVFGAVRYVNVASAVPAAPYTNWSGAARTIQVAIEASAPGDLILVTNGTYNTAGRTFRGANRVAITRAVTVQSVNGPEVTIILGQRAAGTTNGTGAIRCAYLTNGAMLVGFTLTNGATHVNADTVEQIGGGVYCESSEAILSNCVLTANSASWVGGGAYSGTLKNCTLIGNSTWNYGGGASGSTLNNCTLLGNSAAEGGGVYGGTVNNSSLSRNTATAGGGAASYSTLNNCTIAGNSALYGGGINGGTLTNCIVYYNFGRSDPNYLNCTLDHSCTVPLPNSGVGNIDFEPELASASHLSANSPCIARGIYSSVSGLDIDGEPWSNPPSIGCDEFYTGSATGALALTIVASYTNVSPGFSVQFQGFISGHASASRWEFGDGSIVSNRLNTAHAWNTAGDYPVVLRAYNDSYPEGATATVIVRVVPQPVHYVALNNPSAAAPYSSWATAASSIQDAVDAASVPGALVLVTNGIYQTGGRAVGRTTNRVTINKLLTVQSVNGPQVTVIRGYQLPTEQGGPNGDAAIRCAYLTNGAMLVGFTLTNGATRFYAEYASDPDGGGAYCESTNALLSDCLLLGNSSYGRAGAASSGTLNNCRLIGNRAGNEGGATFGSVLNDCTLSGNSAYMGGAGSACTFNNCSVSSNSASYLGGGAVGGTLNKCTLTDNFASSYGGAAFGSTLNNCTLAGNRAFDGGGVYSGTLNNCSLSRNSANGGGGGASYAFLNNCTVTGNSASYSGGINGGTLTNCIVYYNSARTDPNYSNSSFDHSCTTPLPSGGIGNLDSEPDLASPAHLSANSPCIGRGVYSSASGEDIEGDSWANPPSIGCDEFYTASATGPLVVTALASFTNVAQGFSVNFEALISGHASASRWEFADGTILSNRPYASHAWNAAGIYPVVLRVYNGSSPSGLKVIITVHVVTAVHYVVTTGSSPTAPYTSWATAARNIQDAVDAAIVPGAIVLVTNGIYQAGGRSAFGGLTNRVLVDKATKVRSVNGPILTVIRGHRVQDSTNGDSAIRCAYLADGASLEGFTLTNGATRMSGDIFGDLSAGGVYCQSSAAVVSNCVLSGNSAYGYAGGTYSGTLVNCLLVGNNSAYGGGGAYNATLSRCTLMANSSASGGGIASGTLQNCSLIGNSAGSYGGGGSSSTMNNCTLTDNSAYEGGGAYAGALNNCTLIRNFATYGGGASGGSYATFNNCVFAANSAYIGAGVYSARLNNCNVTGNSAISEGGGVAYTTLINSIVYYNTAPVFPNYSGSGFEYSCTTPLPDSGTGNLDTEPELASASHISSTSPCIHAGTYIAAAGFDIDGQPWANPPSMGCDEIYSGSVTGALAVTISASFTNVAVGFPVDFRGLIIGRASTSRWEFEDGTVVSNRLFVSHVWNSPGDYLVTLRAYNDSYPAGVTAIITIHVVTGIYYVALDSALPTSPYDSWATAATNIQDAIDAASAAGGSVLVTNGVYQTGGRAVFQTMTNRVAVDKVLNLRSVNGPEFTIIKGYQLPGDAGGTNGEGAIRCVYLTNGASISGFTLTNGATQLCCNDERAFSGGGVWCASPAVIVSNCVLIGNSAGYGGGARSGTLSYCTLVRNWASGGGGASSSTLSNCVIRDNVADIGGGSYYSTLVGCALSGNSALNAGGGTAGGSLYNCTLTGNSATNSGGGVTDGILTECTLSGNQATHGGGAAGGYLEDCIVTANHAYQSGGGCSSVTLNNCELTANSAVYSGGGAYLGYLANCTIVGNSAEFGGGAILNYEYVANCVIQQNRAIRGGGIYGGTLANCTIVGNSADFAGGTYLGVLNNCIVISNNAAVGENYLDTTMYYSCTAPVPTNGIGNIDVDPLFADLLGDNLRLQPDSPCINSGFDSNAGGDPDLDGNPRIAGGTVDMGAYEFQSAASTISYAWLRHYGLVPTASIDSGDLDGDGANNFQEWISGTVPTNAASSLRILGTFRNALGLHITWQSVTNRTYYIERGANLGEPPSFFMLEAGLVGQTGTTTYIDHNAFGSGPFFYRIGTQRDWNNP